MAFLKKISVAVGFTETEAKIILFLLIALITGLIINFIKEMKNDQNLLQFDYSEQDSMFYSSDQPINEEDSSQKIMEKEVASKRELLDFNVAKKVEKNTISSDFRAKLIDINSASIEQLASLPGIGKKTAELIIIYRNSIVRFSNAGELLNVKGIGKSKLEKIKKLIIVK